MSTKYGISDGRRFRNRSIMENSIYYDEQKTGKSGFLVPKVFLIILLAVCLYKFFTGGFDVLFLILSTLIILIYLAAGYFFNAGLKFTVILDYEFIHLNLSSSGSFKIPINEIYLTEAVKFNPLKDYPGKGIKKTVSGKEAAYFLRCDKGVRVYYPGSDPVVIGAADPQKLINAIQYAQQRKRILSEME